MATCPRCQPLTEGTLPRPLVHGILKKLLEQLLTCCRNLFYSTCQTSGASLVAQLVKNPPAMQETWVQSLGWEDPLRKGMANLSSILAWSIPWTEEPGRSIVDLQC